MNSVKNISVERGRKLFGLDNLGYTCYLNSTLQCLFSFDAFVEKLNECESEQSPVSLCGSLKEILKGEDTRKGLKCFIRCLMKRIKWFRFLEHNDINEFILILFDQLNMEIFEKNRLKLVPLKSSVSCDNNNTLSKFLMKADKCWYDFVKKENTWFNNFCTGQLVHQIICGSCRKIHHNFETFRVIDLQVPNEACDFEDCLKTFFSKSYINVMDETPEDECWKCDNCQQKEKSIKSCKIVRAPSMIVFSLKRFKQINGRYVKNNVRVNISEKINLNEYSVDDENEFQLKGIASHMGVMQGGHYHAMIKKDNNWNLVDDESIKKIPTYDDKSAYTVFFERK